MPSWVIILLGSERVALVLHLEMIEPEFVANS